MSDTSSTLFHREWLVGSSHQLAGTELHTAIGKPCRLGRIEDAFGLDEAAKRKERNGSLGILRKI